MKRDLSERLLLQEKECFSGTAGISDNNRSSDFLPAFQDIATGRVYLSRFTDGRFVPVHVLEGLPDEVVTQRTATGEIHAIKPSVISGFVREGRFFTRAEAAQAPVRCY